MIYIKNSGAYPQRISIPRDDEATGVSHVIQFQSKDYDIDHNGETHIYPDPGYDGITGGTITVHVPTDTQEAYDQGYADGFSSGVTEGEETQKGKLDTLTATTNGHYVREDGYKDVYVDVEAGRDYQQGYEDGEAAQKAKLTELTATTNGHYSTEDGYGDVFVHVEGSGYQDGYQDGEAAQKAKLEAFTATTNGHYTREDGWNEIDVEVPQTGTTAVLVPLTADTNQTYFPAAYSADGFSEVAVHVDTQPAYDQGYQDGQAAQRALLGTLSADTNGTYTSQTGYSAVTVNVPQTGSSASLSSQTFTNNGEYTPQGFDGWSAITINVPTSAGINIPLTATTEQRYAANSFGTYNFNHTSADTLSRLVVYFPQTGVTHIRATYQDDNGWDEPTKLFASSAQTYWINSMTIDGGTPIAPSQYYSFGDSNQHEVVFDLNYTNSYLNFNDCTALTSVDCSELDYNEAPYCYGCVKLYNVRMKQAEIIPAGAFSGCSNYTLSVEQAFPLLKEIKFSAFIGTGVYHLGELHLDSIGYRAFDWCNIQDCNLSYVKEVQTQAFKNTPLTSVRMPIVNNYSIGPGCFTWDTALTTVEFMETKNGRIDYTAFMGCSALTNWSVFYECVPPVIVDYETGQETSTPFMSVPASGIITLMGVGQYSQAWRTWAATYLPGWTVQESN